MSEDDVRPWVLKVRARVRGRPCVTDGLVFAVASSDRLVAADASTGQVRWQVRVPVRSGHLLAGPPWVAEGVVHVSANLTPKMLFNRTEVFGYTVDAGELVRQTTIELLREPPVPDGRGNILFTPGHALVESVDLTTGVPRWRFSVDAERHLARVAISDGGVFVNEGRGSCIRLAADTGKVVWDVRHSDYNLGVLPLPALCAHGRIYVVTDSGAAAALDPDGTIVWRRAGRASRTLSVEESEDPYLRAFVTRQYPGHVEPPMAAGDAILSLRGDGTVTCIEAATGRTRWEARYDLEQRSPVMTTAAATAVVMTSRTLTAWDADTGDVLWSVRGRFDPLGQPPVAARGGLYFGDGRRLRACALRSGAGLQS